MAKNPTETSIQKAYHSAAEITDPKEIVKFWNTERNAVAEIPETEAETLAWLLARAHGRLITLRRDKQLRKIKAERPGSWKQNFQRIPETPEPEETETPEPQEPKKLPPIRELRKMAADAGIPGRGKMNQAALAAALGL